MRHAAFSALGQPRISASEIACLLDHIRAVRGGNAADARKAAERLVSIIGREKQAGQSSRLRGGLAPWQRRKIDLYVRKNLEYSISIKDLSIQVSLSISHFCRCFKQSFGLTPHAYINHIRIERAQELLLTTGDSLGEIAFICGLSDQAHLSRLFRYWTGEAPNAWRRQNSAAKRGNGRVRSFADAGSATSV
jgi:AraC-like DNA-binding protein